jgi:UDP-2-acetamido-2,6-beta-L-arabino-hexul-4-ose reductase
MVIGNGLLARKFQGIDNVIVFASGVSDSSETDQKEFEREKKLLLKVIESNACVPLVYFSSVSILTQSSPYILHKKEMEQIIQGLGINYWIFRLPQIVGFGGCKKNLINFILDKIMSGDEIQIYDTKRSILDVDDARSIVEYIIQNFEPNKILNVGGVQALKVHDIVDILESLTGNKPIVNKIKKECLDQSTVNSKEVEQAIIFLGIKTEFYIKKTLAKYVAHY